MPHPLNDAQKQRLGTLFIQIARGFRAAAGLPLEPNPEATPEVERNKVGPGLWLKHDRSWDLRSIRPHPPEDGARLKWSVA